MQQLIMALLLLWLAWELHRSVSVLLGALRKVLKALDRIETALKPPGASHVEFYITEGGERRKVTKMNLKITQKLPLSIEIKDKFGNPAQVDGAPKWSVTAPELADLEVAEDGMSAKLAPKGTIGSLTVQVSADADLGEGVKAIIGELPVNLLPGEASVIAISAGEPVDE